MQTAIRAIICYKYVYIRAMKHAKKEKRKEFEFFMRIEELKKDKSSALFKHSKETGH